MNQLQAQLEQIQPLHQPSMNMAVRRWNSIAKPLNSLGLLEKSIIQIAGITGNYHIDISKRCAVILCADNGVVAEGISQVGSEITIQSSCIFFVLESDRNYCEYSNSCRNYLML